MESKANNIEFFSKQIKENPPLAFYYCGWQKCTPAHAFGPAIRPHYLFHYILTGRGIYQRGSRSYSLQAGDGFLIRPGESTFYQADDEEPWEYCWISFDGSEVSKILTNCGLGGDKTIFCNQSGGRLQEALLDLVFNYAPSAHDEYALLSRLYLCFSHMAYRQECPKSNTDYVCAAIEYIKNNYSYDIKISEIARHVGIDRTYLYRLFIGSCQTSPQNYLLAFRLGVAVGLLNSTALTIAEIANSCGFSDTASFCHRFKKQFACTPTAYRKNENQFTLLHASNDAAENTRTRSATRRPKKLPKAKKNSPT